VEADTLAGEAATLVRLGAKELILIAQDVSAYGADIYGRLALPDLLPRLSGIEGLGWIRLMYCYEERVTDELVHAMANLDNVCKYIDIPLQHVSDSVLARMGRRSTRKSIEATLGNLRAAMPDIAIRTTLMTGFPGESEDDFSELMDFVAKQRFERLGVFAYSPEEGTRAAQMDGQIDREIAEERRDALMRRQMDISLENGQRLVGRTLTVLVEGSEGEDYIGRSEYDAPEIDGTVVFSSEQTLKTGTFANVLITDAMDYDLAGELGKR
jgi:ribosomal protein S12 methylthiotransferase